MMIFINMKYINVVYMMVNLLLVHLKDILFFQTEGKEWKKLMK